MVKGSVTISIEDYHALIDSNINAKELNESTKLAAKELQVFLSYLCDREDISKYIDEFNRQSKTSTITIQNGRAQIKFNEKT
jgi:heterodisulfide reductase subunit B